MKKRFFKRLIFAYILIVVIYTFIVTGVYFYKNKQFSQYQLHRNQQFFLQQTQNRIDTDLIVGLNWIHQLEFNEYVRKYSNQEETNYYTLIQLNEELKKITAIFSNFNYKIGVSKIEGDLIITPEGTTHKKRYFQKLGIQKQNVVKFKEYLHRKGTQKPYYLLQDPEADYVTLVKKEKINRGGEVLFFLSFYNQTLLPKIHEASHEAFGITTGTDLIAYKSQLEGDRFRKLLGANVIQKMKKDNQTESRYSAFRRGQFLIHVVQSDVLNDWYYIYVTPVMSLGHFSNLIIDSLIIYVILGLLGSIFAFLISKRVYKPITSLVRIFISSENQETRDELMFIEKSIGKIRETNESLKETIQNNRLLVKNNFLRDLLNGFSERSAIQESIEKYDLTFFHHPLKVIIIECGNYGYLEDQFSNEAVYLIKNDILKMIVDKLDGVNAEAFDLDYKRYAVITDETETSKLKKILNRLFLSVESKYELDMLAAIGKTVDVYNICHSYSNALKMLEYRYVFGKKAVIIQEDLKELHHINYYYPLDTERDLINYVIQRKEDQVSQILNFVLNENLYERKLSNEVLSQFQFILAGTLNRILQHLNKSKGDFFDDPKPLYTQLSMCETKEELKQKIQMMFQTIIDKNKVENEQIDRAITDQMISFVHHNYNRDLALTDIADHFNLSAGYMSTLFKNHTGENFKDYLNIHRVEQAKDMLTAQNMKISDLAKQVGCNNVNTFIRIFKKYEGVSPGQYSKNIKG